MKKLSVGVAIFATLVFSACNTNTADVLSGVNTVLMGAGSQGTTSQTTTSKTSGTTSTSGILSSAIGSILGDVLGASNMTEKDLYGTRKYKGSDCVFESQNLLMKAGGEVAAAELESKVNGYLTKAGFNAQKCQFTFNEDKTFSGVFMGKKLSGTYAYDATNKQVKLSMLGGLFTSSPYVVRSLNGNISLLFESDKLLKLASTLGTLSGNDTLKALSTLLSNYDGLRVGLEMGK